MEPAALRKLGTGVVVALLLVGGAFAWRARHDGMIASSGSGDLRAPPRDRVRVEVLNATTTRGLARRATLFLRDAGFDVVRFTNDTVTRDSTLVLDRSGHPDRARQVAKALGGARVESRPDSARFLDVTVLLGADWAPPAKPFYP